LNRENDELRDEPRIHNSRWQSLELPGVFGHLRMDDRISQCSILCRPVSKPMTAWQKIEVRVAGSDSRVWSLPRTTLISGQARVLSLMLSTAVAVVFSVMTYTFATDTALIEPHSLIVDRSLPRAEVDAQVVAARRYDTFWNTGDEALARAALALNFIDNTLPTGRPQGIAGPLAASKFMRLAIPDLYCEIEQMIVAGDRVVAHLRFRGHFTGRFGQVQGQGQAINFIATDIYRIADGRIEDNLTLQQQLGLIAK
jgi:predicted ester cyclase